MYKSAQMIPEETTMFNKISEHIYIRPAEGYTDRPNIGLVIGKNHTLLYDAGNSSAHVEQMKLELMQQGLPAPDIVVLSHWHWDHSFGLHAWNAVSIAGRKTHEKLLEVSNWAWDDDSMDKRIAEKEDITFCSEMIKREYPDRSKIKVIGADIVFDEKLSIDLDGITCELAHSKCPHSDDSVVCFVPEDEFMFLGDSNCKDLYGKPWTFDIEHEEDLLKNLDAIPYDKNLVEDYISFLDEYDFNLCASGHREPFTKKELYESLL